MLSLPADMPERDRLAAREQAIRAHARPILNRLHQHYERGLITTDEFLAETAAVVTRATELVDA